jgi:cell division protein FtsZ
MTTSPTNNDKATSDNSNLASQAPRIGIIGVGGAGGNAINNMIRAKLPGVNFLSANTDSQALAASLATHTLQLGPGITAGLGSGANVMAGRAAAEESVEDIRPWVAQCDLLFVAAGMGGGTGTGAAPVITEMARDENVLCVGVITLPFDFEGPQRKSTAVGGLQELEQLVDTLIVIPNQNLFAVANASTTFADAFVMADEVLLDAIRGITDLIVQPGLINLDFADVRSIITINGRAMMSAGEAAGENRAMVAAEAAITNPLLDIASIKGAQGLLINVSGGSDMTLFEIDAAANRIRGEVGGDSLAIFGSTFDPSLDGKLRVSVVATGLQEPVRYSRPQRIPEPEIEPELEPEQVEPEVTIAAPVVPEPELPQPIKPEMAIPQPMEPVAEIAVEPVVDEADQTREPLIFAALTDVDAEPQDAPVTQKPKASGLTLFERITGRHGDAPDVGGED